MFPWAKQKAEGCSSEGSSSLVRPGPDGKQPECPFDPPFTPRTGSIRLLPVSIFSEGDILGNFQSYCLSPVVEQSKAPSICL
jgi:hypothetical protein